MTFYEFVFTKKRPQKYMRHLAFWVGQSVFWVVWAGIFFVPVEKWMRGVWHNYLGVNLLLEITYTYLIVYLLLPKYFAREKFIRFGILFFVLSVLFWFLFELHYFLNLNLIKAPKDQKLLMGWYFTMNFIINGPPVVCALFLTLKMLKNYYAKTEEKRILVQENAQAELQLLKAQVHPHFLFNTLNNIYSFTLTRSPDAGKLVLQLSNTLRYMIYDCEAPNVPLEKEIQLLQNYIGLEKVRYGNRLQLQVAINGNYENKTIAPLLMIPFVENSFKHGPSVMRGEQWIRIELNIYDNWLYFTISNSKPLQPNLYAKEGIGLLNVQKRLQLLYPGKHYLNIESTAGVFTVQLQVQLAGRLAGSVNDNPIVHAQALSYA